jgi:hypothetical protein
MEGCTAMDHTIRHIEQYKREMKQETTKSDIRGDCFLLHAGDNRRIGLQESILYEIFTDLCRLRPRNYGDYASFKSFMKCVKRQVGEIDAISEPANSSYIKMKLLIPAGEREVELLLGVSIEKEDVIKLDSSTRA